MTDFLLRGGLVVSFSGQAIDPAQIEVPEVVAPSR